MSNNNPGDLFADMMQLSRQMMRYAHLGMCGRPGLRQGQAHLLEIIARQNGASQRDLAEELDVRPSSMTEMLGRLAQAGWIRREQDEQDQRIMRVYLTEAGQKIIDDSSDTRGNAVGIIFSCLTEEEREQLAAINQKLSKHLENLDSSLRNRLREEMREHACGRHPHGGVGRPPFNHRHHWEHSCFNW